MAGDACMRSISMALAIVCVLAFCQASYAQSTFGTVLGTVKDPSGSAVPMATVESHEHWNQRGKNAITNYERRI